MPIEFGGAQVVVSSLRERSLRPFRCRFLERYGRPPARRMFVCLSQDSRPLVGSSDPQSFSFSWQTFEKSASEGP